MTEESPAQKPSLFKQQPLGMVALILAIIALVFAALAWQQYGAVHENADRRAAKLQQAVTQIQTDFQQYQTQSQTAIQDNEKNIAALTNQLNDTKSAPILMEVNSLIRLANLHLTFDNNVAQALQLLKVAQTRLQSITSSTTQPLKEAIEHDINALSAVPQINASDLNDQIEQLGKQIAALEIQSPLATQSRTPPEPLAGGSWWDRIKHNLGGLKDLFIVRRIEEPVTEPLTEKHFILLQERIQMKLLQAQWALLYLQKNIYQQSLHTAAQWLNELSQNQPATQALIKKLEALAVIDIKPQTPSLQSMQVLAEQNSEKSESTHP